MIKRSLSVYLDVLRFGAAFVVLLSHFAYPRFTGGRYIGIRDYNLGSDAVVIFFVLSGLVITFTGTTKDETLGRFAFNRATRLISVAVPAILVTFLFDRAGANLATEEYTGWWYNPISFVKMLVSGLTYSSEWNGQGVRLGTNGPYWSLSYEVAYYALFGLALYLRGAVRWLSLAIAVLLFGFNVMILLPAWLVGVWVYRRLQDPTSIPASKATLMAFGPIVLYVLMLAVDVPGNLTNLTVNLSSQGWVNGLRFSDEFIWNWLLAGLFAIHLLGMATWLGEREFARVDVIRWLAGASFSLYLVHYPIVQFFSSVLPKSDIWIVDDAVLLAITVAICLVFAQLFERQLKPFRAVVRRLFGSHQATSAPRQTQGSGV